MQFYRIMRQAPSGDEADAAAFSSLEDSGTNRPMTKVMRQGWPMVATYSSKRAGAPPCALSDVGGSTKTVLVLGDEGDGCAIGRVGD